MSRSTARNLADRAAAAAARFSEEDPAEAAPPAEALAPEPAAAEVTVPRTGGRPRGRRAVAARQTVYLDEARHAALIRIAEDRGRSVHSLILEGIDAVIGKPAAPGWRE